MRKPRDFDSELKVLTDKASILQERKLRQFGELVVATGADALPIEQLAGALLAACNDADMMRKEDWRARGAAFFQGSRRSAGEPASPRPGGAQAGGSREASASGERRS